MPTLVIVGDLDTEQVIEMSDLLADKIPNAQKVVMKGTAHLPNMELPEQFNRILNDFLGDGE